jgi:hypothetical protein
LAHWHLIDQLGRNRLSRSIWGYARLGRGFAVDGCAAGIDLVDSRLQIRIRGRALYKP